MQHTLDNSALQLFDYEGATVRTTVIDGEVWFITTDVCDILGLSNPTMALQELDDDEKMTLSNSEGHSGQRGGAQFLNVISEPGLYALVFKSRKPEAKAFARWVRHEVLPQVMHYGSYTAPSYGMDAVRKIASEQSKLELRRVFWERLAASFEPAAKMLLYCPNGYYEMPAYMREDINDRTDIDCLRSLLLAAQEFMKGKIRALESREHILECAARL